MTKRQTRAFFYAGTGLFTIVFLALTVDSHRQFGKLTNSDAITPQVVAGKHVWHKKNCINCHTLLGEGAYYAPDLTKITDLRGEAYLRAFLKEPGRFYNEKTTRRIMPNLKLSDQEITEVIAFLTWTSRIDTHGWPPRPILVSGSSIPGMGGREATAAGTPSDPVAQGDAIFHTPTVGCFACHSTAPGVSLVGPSLAGVATRAAHTIADPSYTGHATTPGEYLRESIVSPSAHIVTGGNYANGNQSLMPGYFGETLKTEQIDALVAYLSTTR
jgi:nitric oxide reductase subunit C